MKIKEAVKSGKLLEQKLDAVIALYWHHLDQLISCGLITAEQKEVESEGFDKLVEAKLFFKGLLPKLPPQVNYYDPEYRKLRHEIFLEQGEVCQKCGATPPKAVMHIDHIRPISKHPELFLSKDNLQVLCKDCNLEKSNFHETDYRGPHEG